MGHSSITGVLVPEAMQRPCVERRDRRLPRWPGHPHRCGCLLLGPASADLFCDFNCLLKRGNGSTAHNRCLWGRLAWPWPRPHRRHGEPTLFGMCSRGWGACGWATARVGGCCGCVPVAPASPCRAVGRVSHQVPVSCLGAGAQPPLTPAWPVCPRCAATPLGGDGEP